MTKKTPRSNCPLAKSLAVFGDRWSLLIVRDMMMNGKVTFNEMLTSPEKSPTNTLTTRLRQLEEAGLIQKSAYQTNPTRYHYELTQAGDGLKPVHRRILYGNVEPVT